MTTAKNLTLVEKRLIDHTVFVYKDGDTLRIKLLDDDEDGNFVDGAASIREMGAIIGREMAPVGRYLIPFVDGTATPASAKQVAFIVRHLPMTVERIDRTRSKGRVVKSYELTPAMFPENDDHLLGLLKGCPLDADFSGQPWAPVMVSAMTAAANNDVFAKTPGTVEHDVFATTGDSLFAAT